jgi:hypothetical protein
MSFKLLQFVLVLCASLFLTAIANAAQDFSGNYQGPKLFVAVVHGGPAYGGEIRMGQQSFPMKAHEESGRLVGTFATGGVDYVFSATCAADEMTLVSGGATYSLKRQTPSANPLAAATEAKPIGAGNSAAMAKYAVVIHTDSGQTLSIKFPDVTSATEAYKRVFPDLEKFFGARPNITGAFQDGGSEGSSFATFDASLGSQPVKGLVSPKVSEKGMLVYVVYCRADAPPIEWKKLLGLAPTIDVALKQFDFPDGTGSMGLADGWTTQSRSLMNTTLLTGPGDEQIVMGFSVTCCTPDSNLVRQQKQREDFARAMHLPPPPAMPLVVAAMGEPGETLTNLTPALSQLSQKYGGPAITLDRIIEEKPQPAVRAGVKVSLVRYDVTRTTAGVAKHYRAAARIEVDPLLPGSYTFSDTELVAPIETFDRDLPTMYLMMCSIKVNEQVVAAKTQANFKLQNEIFHMSMESARKQQIAMGQQAADMDEILIGSRTVEDTDTGVRRSVNLADVHQIVQKLNEAGGHHYKEIPLRDEIYPQH